jgi:hypothetical protein
VNRVITPDNAREMQARSVAARRRNQIAQQTTPAEPDIFGAVKRQIAEVLQDMEQTRSRKEKARLVIMLEKLWNMVYPKAGARKPGRDSGRGRAIPVAAGDWQPATELTTQPSDTQQT